MTEINSASIPQELREQRRWVDWRWQDREGKPTKVPFVSGTDRKAKSSDPTTWSTFQAAFRSHSSSLYTWLHRITVNACMARLRTARAKSEVSIADDKSTVAAAFEGLPPAWSDAGPSVARQLVMRRALQKALSLIPEEFRTVLHLRDVEDMISREVADQLGIPDGTVRQRLHHAGSAMAELLRPELCNGPELTCGGQLDLLLDYIENALPAELQTSVHDHIEGCPTCSSMRDIYRVTVGTPRAIAELTAMDSVPNGW